MAQRRKDNQVRNDILESLRNVLRNSNTFEEEKDIVSVAANFFSNGFELSANVRKIAQRTQLLLSESALLRMMANFNLRHTSASSENVNIFI